jgi:geranylgeranyl pyrophosphate synthase
MDGVVDELRSKAGGGWLAQGVRCVSETAAAAAAAAAVPGTRFRDSVHTHTRYLLYALPLRPIDDLLDFLPPSPTLGKPSLGADLSLGLTTAPVLYAWLSNPALGPLIARK